MRKNLGNIDKVVRVMIAAIITVLYFTGVISGTLAIALLIVGGVLVLTTLLGTCPLYLPFGIDSSKKK